MGGRLEAICYVYRRGNSTKLEACVARKLASSLYLAFNGQYNYTLAFSAVPVTHSKGNHARTVTMMATVTTAASDSVTRSHGHDHRDWPGAQVSSSKYPKPSRETHHGKAPGPGPLPLAVAVWCLLVT